MAAIQEAEIPPQSCLNCGHPEPGRFCPSCGQKTPQPNDLSARQFAADIAESLSNVEGRFWRTLRTLLTRPGQLTRDYIDGKRQRYLKPIQLFVTSNVWFFLAQSFTHYNTFTTPLNAHLHGSPYSSLMRPYVAEVLRRSGLTEKDFTTKINNIMEDQAKTLVFLMVPLFAVFVWLLVGPRRPYGHYLIFAAHVYAMLMIVLPFTAMVDSLVLPSVTADLLLVLGIPVYFALALQRAFNLRPLRAWPTSLLLLIALIVVITMYRFLLLVCGLVLVRG